MSELVLSLMRIALMLLAVYAVCAVLGHFASLRLIFPRPPATYALTPDVIRVTTPDGVQLAMRHWANPEAKYTLLWFGGNAEDLGRMADSVAEWHKHGFAILATEYRGYGHSGGTPTEADTYADAALALAWLQKEKGVPLSRIIIYGYSLGSGPAVELATREKVAGLVLLAPFVSAYRVMTVWPVFPWDKFRNLEKIPRIKCPVLVIQGSEDRTIAPWHGPRVFAAAPDPKRALWVPGAGHGDVSEVAGERYWETVKSFAESL